MNRNLLMRLLLGVLVFTFLAGLWWMLTTEEPVLEDSTVDPGSPAVVEQVVSEPPASLDFERSELIDHAAGATEVYAPNAKATVLAELTTVKGEAGHAPPNCQAWEVTVQYRREADGPTAAKSACVDASGRVSIELDAYVKVERITCIPPADRAFGFAVDQTSFELVPQQEKAVLLHITPAQSAFGKVVDHHGEAVANASVHVFPRKHNPGLYDWHGGIVTTSTDADGNFRFDQMPDGAWAFAVQPTVWLMYSPGLEEQSEGHGLLFFYGEEDDVSDVGTLSVVPMSVVKLTMVGSNGAPAIGQYVTAIPMHFDDPLIKASEEDDFQSVDDILLPYTRYLFRTDENGQANMPLVRGSWRLQMPGPFGTDIDAKVSPDLLFSTKQSTVRFTLDCPVASIRGRLVDNQGAPIAQVQVQLRANYRKLFTSPATTSNGKFSMPSIARRFPWQLYALPKTRAFLPAAWDLSDHDWEQPFHGVLQSSVSLQLRVLDLESKPHPPQNLSLHFLDWEPDGAIRKTDHGEWWRETANHAAALHQSRPTILKGLFPGSYTVSLMYHPDRLDPITGARPEAREMRRWTLETGDAVHEIQVALSR